MKSNLKKKSVLFRVDSSHNIGYGHFSRCLILAEELKKKYNIIFIFRELSLVHLKKIKQLNFNYFKLNYSKARKRNNKFYKVDQVLDAKNCYLKVKNFYDVHYIILDCYYLHHFWEKEIFKLTNKIIVIDDLANRKHYCDILIDQNYHLNKFDRYKNLLLKKTKLLLGLKYVILSKEIRSYKLKVQKLTKVKNVLIFFGGTDIKNLTTKVLHILLENKAEKLYKFTVIVTSSNQNIKTIKKICSKYKIKLIVNTEKMGFYISRSDFILSTGGIFTWEKLFFNKPSLVIPSNINQVSILNNLNKKKILKLLMYKNFNKFFYKKFSFIVNNSNILKQYVQNSKGMIDSQGVKRIIKNIISD